ncbi:hypothetical protein [Maribacter flavus]|uniref:Uncharacterized protein n=1 Tax=Maribacter flavus TaxID=1658664 RepID=A0A5B2TNN9_9FLAO|nr:hypothetical protein [Maribacter flavus]KAA2215595.1 hypothetical protein F0361_18355 [Maribacter flavus]
MLAQDSLFGMLGQNPFFLRKRNPRRKRRGFCVLECVVSKLAKAFGSEDWGSKACVGFMSAQDSLFGSLGQNPFFLSKRNPQGKHWGFLYNVHYHIVEKRIESTEKASRA